MSQKTRNGNIASFFRSESRTNSEPSSVQPPKSPSVSPPPTPSSQRRIVPITPTTNRVKEIKASDDEDDGDSDDSEDDLEDLADILCAGKARPSPAPNLYATPKAKRTALDFHSSPLAVLPRHTFDLKALARDAKTDRAVGQSSLRAAAAKEASDLLSASAIDAGDEEIISAVVEDGDDHETQKVLRAVQRARPAQSQTQYRFFKHAHKPRLSTPPPKIRNPGIWKLLCERNVAMREQHLTSGVLQTVLQKRQNLPDELFEWMLDEICVQESLLLRTEYANMIWMCPGQTERLVTPERLDHMFLLLGAEDDLTTWDAKVSLSRSLDESKLDQEWSSLTSVLDLLGYIAPQMTLESTSHAVKILFRMSMDPFLQYSIDLARYYKTAVISLLEVIPNASWDTFCFETCNALNTVVRDRTTRSHAVFSLPVSDSRAHEIRRRLALTFLFDDAALARHHPDDVITMDGLVERVRQDDFKVRPKTDFADLRAAILLLNAVIDDGGFVASDGQLEEDEFNAKVDELAGLLRTIWREINDAGMKIARTETKTAVEWVQQRLTHSVRTRKKAKQSVFDLPGTRQQDHRPQQQDYMKAFLQKAKNAT